MAEAYLNDVYSYLASGISSGATSLDVVAGTGVLFVASGSLRLRIDNEILICTARSTDTLTVTRGAEGTSAAAHSAGATVEHILTAASLQALPGVTGNFGIGVTATQPLHVYSSSTGNVVDVEREGGQGVVRLTAWNNSANPVPQVQGRSSRGTKASPTAISAGDDLFRLTGVGQDNSGTLQTTATARYRMIAAEAFTTTGKGAHHVWDTTPVGAVTTPTEKMRLTSEGDLTLDSLDLNGAAAQSPMINGSMGIWQRSASSTLNGAINNSVTTITLVDSGEFPASGAVIIESEIITYSGNSGNQLTGCTRGTYGTSAASHVDTTAVLQAHIADGYTADGWSLALGSSAAAAIHYDSTNVVGVYSARCMRIRFTDGSTDTRITQKYQDWAQARSKALCFSMYVKSSTASAVRISIYDGVTRTYSTYHTGGGTYERLTVTATSDAAATTLLLEVNFEAGTAIDVYLDNAQWVYGTRPGTYWSADPTIEKVRCQRYYQRLPVTCEFRANAASEQARYPLWWTQEANGTPTVSLIKTGTRSNVTSVAYTATNAGGGYVTVVATSSGSACQVTGDIIEIVGAF